MATSTDAQKIEKYRAAANDKTIPQDVRNQMLDKANELERKAYEATKKLAKGGMVSNKGVGASMKPHNMFKAKK
jgi:hypothetical protein